jgi:hypothetical protein
MGTAGSLPGGKLTTVESLTTYLHLAPKLWRNKALLPVRHSSWCRGCLLIAGNLYLFTPLNFSLPLAYSFYSRERVTEVVYFNSLLFTTIADMETVVDKCSRGTEDSWKKADRRNTKSSKKNRFQWHFFHHKSHMDLTGIESGPSSWETGLKAWFLRNVSWDFLLVSEERRRNLAFLCLFKSGSLEVESVGTKQGLSRRQEI